MSRDRESGFAILELLVVLVIIAILAAMAAPNLLGVRRQAYDMQVKLALSNAAKAEAALETTSGGYLSDPAALEAVMPELDFAGDGDSRIWVEVADVEAGDRGQVLLYSRSVTGNWFGIRLVLYGADAGRHTCSGAKADMTMDACSGVDW
jgi:prepilin-type N-terminal cleavage/methylation domain-containing protein